MVSSKEGLDRALRRRLAASRKESLDVSKSTSKRRRAKHSPSTVSASTLQVLRDAALASKCAETGKDVNDQSDCESRGGNGVLQDRNTSNQKPPRAPQLPSEAVTAQLSLLRKLAKR